ncbi:MAG: S8 family serine peptidase [Paenibacillaceae bacterium]|nr:S8 family serine peptidase [Paenibacillaceae bacterium]
MGRRCVLIVLGAVCALNAVVVHANTVRNDSFFSRQSYINVLRVPQAWALLESAPLAPVTVAVVDTGVDMTHPDLVDVLLPGINIVDRMRPPQDDVGHGTHVAGVIAAIADNKEGISGIAPNVSLLPIKAINKNGYGTEEQLSEGIRAAIDQGAHIVVLALGMHLNAPVLQDVVAYAEKKNVVLVAASGNNGTDVTYPAAYPTVIAVGGINKLGKVHSQSNWGQEIDFVAPWDVYTTALGGKYAYAEGTSMAAPQVAAIVALLLGKEPGLSPSIVRQRLRQAASLGVQVGWNAATGYGVIRADALLRNAYRPDGYEPNNNPRLATPASVIDTTLAQLNGTADDDWYVYTPPAEGVLNVSVRALTDAPLPIEVVVDRAADASPTRQTVSDGDSVRISVTTEPIRIGLHIDARAKLASSTRMDYRLTTDFAIAPDDQEPNDTEADAFVVKKLNATLKGTFHQIGDEDWFLVPIPRAGIVRAKLELNTPRIDGELRMIAQDDRRYDDGGEGENEFSEPINVRAGFVRIRVRNVKSRFSLPVVGTYTLYIQYEPKLNDENEPNNSRFTPTPIVYDKMMRGLFHTSKDEDWFSFRLLRRETVQFVLTELPRNRIMYVQLLAANGRMIEARRSAIDDAAFSFQRELSAGTYTVRLMTDVAYQDRQYAFVIRRADDSLKQIGNAPLRIMHR